MQTEPDQKRVVATGRDSNVGSVLIGGILVLLAILVAVWMFWDNRAVDSRLTDTLVPVEIAAPDTEPTTEPSDA